MTRSPFLPTISISWPRWWRKSASPPSCSAGRCAAAAGRSTVHRRVAAFDDLHVDKLFLGVDGLDTERGITTHFEPEAILNRKMVAAATNVIAVTDQSKFDRICLHRIALLDEIDQLVTDGEVPEKMRLAAERAKVTIRIG